MITRTTENAIAARTAQRSLPPAQRTSRSASTAFAGVLQSTAKTAATTTKSAQTAGAGTAPAAQTKTTSAATKPNQTAAVSPQAASVTAPAGDLASLPSVFTREAFEYRMNNWLTATINRQNEQKMDVYNQAVKDWETNAQRCRELGIAAPQAPKPPQLETAEAKPAGWWFQANS